MKSYTLGIAQIFYFVWARTVCLTVRCNTLLILIATYAEFKSTLLPLFRKMCISYCCPLSALKVRFTFLHAYFNVVYAHLYLKSLRPRRP